MITLLALATHLLHLTIAHCHDISPRVFSNFLFPSCIYTISTVMCAQTQMTPLQGALSLRRSSERPGYKYSHLCLLPSTNLDLETSVVKWAQ